MTVAQAVNAVVVAFQAGTIGRDEAEALRALIMRDAVSREFMHNVPARLAMLVEGL